MNVITRGIRNAFRNAIRTVSIVIILGLSIGLSLTMLVAHRAVGQKIDSVKGSIGNTVSIAPAGVQGFEGGGNPLTVSQLADVAKLPHVSKLTESVNDRLTSSDTNLVSSVNAGSLGKRFYLNQNGNGGFARSFGGDGQTPDFTLPVSAIGTSDPSMLNGTALRLTSGQLIDGSADKDVALAGTSLANKNNLKVGSTFTAYGSTITVAGIFDTGTQFANNQIIFSLPTLQRLSGQSGDVTSAVATIDSISNIDSATSAIKSKLGSAADITNSKDTANAALAPLQSIQSVSLYSLVGAVIAGAVIILLTMIMIVRERKREIGVVKAIGASNVRIAVQFMAEALTLTVLGAVIGLIIGVTAGNPVTKMLVNNSNSSASTVVATPGGGRGFGGGIARQFRQNSAIRGLDNIQAEIGWSILLDGFGAAVVIAVVGSAIAAGMIAKIRPAQVMRAD